MKLCPNCGTSAPDHSNFCSKCGAPLPPQPTTATTPTQSAYLGTPPARAPRTDPMAVWALITGIAGLVLCPIIASIPAVVLGIFARKRIRSSGDSGEGLATAGLALGIVGIAIIPLLVAIAIPTFLGARRRAQDRQAQAVVSHVMSRLGPAALGVGEDPTVGQGDYRQVAADVESGGPGEASVLLERAKLVVAVRSASGTCFMGRLQGTPEGEVGVSFTPEYAAFDDGSCRASDHSTVQGWSRSWPRDTTGASIRLREIPPDALATRGP